METKNKKVRMKFFIVIVVLLSLLFLATPIVIAEKIEIIKERTIPSNSIEVMSATDEPQKKVYEVKKVTQEEYEKLKENKGVRVQKNYKVTTFLDDSTGIIGADDAWQREIAGSNIKGQGETICVIDTGVDYTHSAFGGCEPEFSTNQVDFSMEKSSQGTYEIEIDGIEAVSLYFSNITEDIDILYEGYVYETITSQGESSVIPSDDGLEIYVPDDSEFTIDSATNHSATWDDCKSVEGGFDFVDRSIDPDDDNDPEINGGHGTHVAGIAAGNDDTITGVAPEANIYIVKVLGEEGGSFADISMGIRECAKNAQKHGISSIVMSLGTEEYKSSDFCDNDFSFTADEIDYATSKGIIVSVATGNEGETNNISSPACIESSTRVGATDKNDNIWDSTNRGGDFNDILMAPGVDITSSHTMWDYAKSSGTSMAAPHIAGSVALIRHYEGLKNEDYTNDDIFHSLNSTGETIYDSGSNEDYTRINVFEALTYHDIDIEKNYSEKVLRFGKDNLTINYSINTFGKSLQEKNLTVKNRLNETVYEDLDTNKMNANLNKTHLNTTGRYMVNLSAIDDESNSKTKITYFYVKRNPEFNVTFDGKKENLRFHYKNNITMNFTLNKGKNVSLYINDSFNNSFIFNETKDYNLSKGIYNLTFEHKNASRFFNHTKKYTLNVTNLTPEIESFRPAEKELLLELNETKNFSINATNTAFEELNYTWLVDGETKSTNKNYTINSSDFSPGEYNITAIVNNSHDTASVSWNLSIYETLAPIITDFKPEETELLKELNETINFTVNLSNPTGEELNHNWSIDGEEFNNSQNITINTTEVGEGFHQIKYVVNNTYGFSKESWNISVHESYRPVIRELLPEYKELYHHNAYNFTINATSPDESPLNYTWEFNQSNVSEQRNFYLNTSFYELGNYTLIINITNSNGTTTKERNITINPPRKPKINMQPKGEFNLSLINNVTINQTTSCYDNRSLEYYWFVNNTLESNEANYTFNATEWGLGTHIINFTADNNWTNNSKQLEIWVFNNSIEFYNSISDMEMDEDGSIELNLLEHFNYSGFLPVNYTLMNSSLVEMKTEGHEAEFSPLESGSEKVKIKAENKESNTTSNKFLVEISEVEKDDGSDDTVRTRRISPLPDEEEEINETEDDKEEEIKEDGLKEEIIEKEEEKTEEKDYIYELKEKPGQYFLTVEKASEKISFTGNNTLTYTQIKLRNELYNFTLKVTETEESIIDFRGFTYRFINLSYNKSHKESFDSAELTFRIKKEWIKKNNISKEEIKVFRYNKGWEKQNTSIVGKNDKHIFYKTNIEGLSLFLIGKREPNNITTSSDDKHTESINKTDEHNQRHILNKYEIAFLIFIILIKITIALRLISAFKKKDDKGSTERKQIKIKKD